ncbi:MAG TPA: MFS transporter [Firmicutes bacterium]|nr:MFS transporter [Bacillota bacterium]
MGLTSGLAIREKSRAKAIAFALAMGALFMYADRTVLYPMLKVIADDFNLSGTATGFITSTYFSLYVAMQVPAGLLGDRLGLRRVLINFYLLGAVALLLLGLSANSYILLIVLVGLHGIGMGAYYPTSYGINIGTVPKESRGLASAIINSGMSIGTALGLVFSGPIYSQTGSWRLPFLLLAVPTLFVPFLFRRYLPEPGNSAKTQPGGISQGINLKKILADKDLWALNLAAFCAGYGFWVALTWGPSFFAGERSLELTAAGVLTALPALSAIPSALLVGRLSDQLGRRQLALILYPLQAITIFLLAYVKSFPVLTGALVFYGIVGRTVSDTVIVSWFGDYVSRKSPNALGAAVGIFNLVGMSSAVIAPLISGMVKDLTGSLVGAFYIGALIVLAGMLCTGMAKEA